MGLGLTGGFGPFCSESLESDRVRPSGLGATGGGVGPVFSLGDAAEWCINEGL